MREIKFRGMRLSGNWAYGLLAISKHYPGQPERGYYISNSCGMPWAYSVRPETVGRYTGRRDEIGKEVYEGDKLEVYRQGDKQKNPYVVGDICEFYFDLNTIDSYMRIEEKSLKIIGNIHENPELAEPC